MADRIPIAAAESIGKQHRYDQVVILARRVGADGQEWVTTWGKNAEHCRYAARIGDALRDDVTPTLERLTARVAELEADPNPDPQALRQMAEENGPSLAAGDLWWNPDDPGNGYNSMEDAFGDATQWDYDGPIKLDRAALLTSVWALKVDLDTTGDGEAGDYEIRLFATEAEADAHKADALGAATSADEIARSALPRNEGEAAEPCFECGSTDRVGTACRPCNPEITDGRFGLTDDAARIAADSERGFFAEGFQEDEQ